MNREMDVNSDFNNVLQDELDKALKRRGRVNILIAGKTGVGKSTLINAVFQEEIATTGQGRPITPNVREITKEGVPVTIFDTRGLEIGKYEETIQAVEMLLKDRNTKEDANKHLHVAWICIQEGSSRVEEGESKLAEMLASYVPTIAVITKAISDNGFRQKVQELLPQVPNVVRVRAKEDILDDGYKLGAIGLENLVELTMEVVPEGQKNAFVASQRISLKHKVNRAHGIVATAAASAAGIGATPIPFSDALVIVPIQIGMLAGISSVWGLRVNTALIRTLVSSAITGSLGTLGGRAAASTLGELLKLIPGVGSVVGGTINATTAFLLTTAFGEAYIASLYILTKDKPDKIPTAEEVRDVFVEQLQTKKE